MSEFYYERYNKKCAVCGEWYPPRNRYNPLYMCHRCRDRYIAGPCDFHFSYGPFSIDSHWRCWTIRQQRKIFSAIRSAMKQYKGMEGGNKDGT